MTFKSDQDRQLFQLQLKVAQRADELTRLLKNPGHAFELWRQAESEILGGMRSEKALPPPRF